MNDIKILKLLQQIDTFAYENGLYSNIMPSQLQHELDTHKDLTFCAAHITGYYSDQDGGEAPDDLYEFILESIEEMTL